jgi:hypothetical protein
MIYIEQDFYSNFTNAVKSNDDNAIRSMLSDEVSRLISQRKDLTDLLKKINISYSESPTNEELSNTIINNISNDHKLRVGLAYLIAKNNDIVLPKKNEREKEDENIEDSKKVKTDTVTSISTSISTFIKSNKNNLDSFKDEIIEKSNNKAPNLSEFSIKKRDEIKTEEAPKDKKKSKTWLWVLLGLAVVGGGIYLAHKKGWISFGKGNSNNPDLGGGNALSESGNAVASVGTPSMEVPTPSIPAPSVPMNPSVTSI